ncbi:MAG: hypothetical protein PHC30_03045 [Lentisphaeria bacterium]|nr:hypothetical protein [Lentisphaeria bacterium]
MQPLKPGYLPLVKGSWRNAHLEKHHTFEHHDGPRDGDITRQLRAFARLTNIELLEF